MKVEDYIKALGFTGVAKRKIKSKPSLIQAFVYEKVDYIHLRKVLGKATTFSADTGRHVFSVAADKTIMIDALQHTVVLGNGVKAAHVLRASVLPKPTSKP
jgi:hypothetical protein